MNENIKNIAKIINSKCRFQNCNDCIKLEDTCWEFETAIALDKAGYRKQSEVAREVISKVMAILSGIKEVKGEDCFFTYEGNCDKIDEQLNRLAEQFGKENE